jgi:hypothetical protein
MASDCKDEKEDAKTHAAVIERGRNASTREGSASHVQRARFSKWKVCVNHAALLVATEDIDDPRMNS